MAIRRSVPLTAMLLQLFLEEKVADPLAPMPIADKLRLWRDLAWYGLARVCMLRKNDMLPSKLKAGCYKQLPHSEGQLLVDPGKSHRSEVFAEVPGVPKSALRPSEASEAKVPGILDDLAARGALDWVSPGYAMRRWLELYEQHLGTPDRPHGASLPDHQLGGQDRRSRRAGRGAHGDDRSLGDGGWPTEGLHPSSHAARLSQWRLLGRAEQRLHDPTRGSASRAVEFEHLRDVRAPSR